jgi:hypothetical protein
MALKFQLPKCQTLEVSPGHRRHETILGLLLLKEYLSFRHDRMYIPFVIGRVVEPRAMVKLIAI